MAQRQGQSSDGSSAVRFEMAVTHLERLASELRSAGWKAVLSVPRDGCPCVHVANPYLPALNDDVIAAPDTAGGWWFWWSWAERIAQITDVPRVLARVGQVLAANGDR